MRASARKFAGLAWYPFLLVTFVTSTGYSIYLVDYEPADYLVITGLALGFTAALFLLARAFIADRHRAALLVLGFLLLFFAYGQLTDPLEDRLSARGDLATHVAAVSFCGVVLSWWGWRLRQAAAREKVTVVLNVFMACLLVMPAAQILHYYFWPQRGTAWQELPPPVPPPRSSSRPAVLPDIYYLVFDRYGGEDTLRRRFGVDNRSFYAFLRARGFYVAAQSRSNYLKTAPSLASSLNLQYLDDLAAAVGPEFPDWSPLKERIEHHAAGRFLQAQGYTFVQAGSWWGPTRHSEQAARNINRFDALPLELVLTTRATLLQPFAEWLELETLEFRRQQWARTLYQLEELSRVPDDPRPLFVFAHFLLPHDPYVFEPDGSFVPESVEEERSEEDAYRRQLAFTNAAIRRLVDRLLASRPAPVIILQADEGPFPARYQRDGLDFDWTRATADELREKTSILNAYYLPGVAPRRLYPQMTPVNTFRIIFNEYFGAGLPLLPDRTFAHTNDHLPYSFFEVTHVITPPRPAPATVAGPARPPRAAP